MLDDDYFNSNGQYLGTDNAETDFVRIIENDYVSFEDLGQKTADGTMDIAEIVKQGLTSVFSSAMKSMSTEAILSVYQHYNTTDLQLELAPYDYLNMSSGMEYHAEKKGSNVIEGIYIYAKGNATSKLADHANEITNSFVHEGQHYSDTKTMGFDAMMEMTKTNRSALERRAIIKQMNHESFNKTRDYFQSEIKRYGEVNGLAFPLSPLPPSNKVIIK
jgi:hypothetical protein